MVNAHALRGPRIRGLALALAALLLLSACSSSVAPIANAPGDGQSAPTATARPTTSHKPRPQHHPTNAPSSGSAHPPGVPAADVPDHALTPGIALHVGASQICVPGYSTAARAVSDAEKTQVYNRYHVRWVPYQHEVDHLISLELGGSNAIGNLWPEPYAGRWGARTKDALENRLHDLVCAGQLSLMSAQHQEATDWVAAYRRYMGGTPTGPGSSGGGGGSGSASGGYYASRYPSASTIYCADDPAWRELSKTYLTHFDTLAQAEARFPSYHLHQPC
jgi:hypothetical protein